eukprot:CAMPEP_0170169764 /NCGR_PEP_ID=MMETSP0040_2-20121228/2708_1 /TAXON_ID=641309 /ORGANISM="Lotharella oceanica, Strain CCMP622" /LENGTH=70 /DNA_ID=CAMNT_0010408715 /DNA_START=95 /DNA_END=304 /DNA_ORIENTATION=-
MHAPRMNRNIHHVCACIAGMRVSYDCTALLDAYLAEQLTYVIVRHDTASAPIMRVTQVREVVGRGVAALG